MDLLKQTKLSRSEWETLEVPVIESEARILALLKDGYENTRVVHNHSQNMIQFSKLPCNDGMHHYIYTKYFQSLVDAWKNKYGIVFAIESRSIKKSFGIFFWKINPQDLHLHRIYSSLWR